MVDHDGNRSKLPSSSIVCFVMYMYSLLSFILLSSVSNLVLPDEHTNVLLLDVVSTMTLTDPLVVVWRGVVLDQLSVCRPSVVVGSSVRLYFFDFY